MTDTADFGAEFTADFGAALAPLRPALRLHCYRMLGSSHDSDDMVQEAMLRAWRARDTLADPSRIKPWLYRIATNACLDELARRPRRAMAADLAPPVPGDRGVAAPIDDAAWLEPMPDTWIAGAEDPAARYALRESVALAFVAALQVLPAAQRAVLLLRDVIGFTAEETAEALAQSVSATHSALHRARTAVEDRIGGRAPEAFAGGAEDAAVLARYVDVLERHDIDGMIALMHDDMQTTMPPSPTWIAGRADNAAFYRWMFERWEGVVIRAVPARVNGGLGCEFYRDGTVRAIEAVQVADGKLLRVHHFMQPAVIALFARAA